MSKLGIVLPTYNEASNLRAMIGMLEGLSMPVDLHLFIVDDNSPDGTSDVAEEQSAIYGNISVITRNGKFGLGSALRDGINAAIDEGCHHVLTMDADLSHDPMDVPTLLEAACSSDIGFVQASRYIPGGMVVGWSRSRRFKSWLANTLCQWLLDCPKESTTNFRIYSREIAKLVVRESKGNHFEFQPECVLITKQHGYRVLEVPITFKGRTDGKSKLGIAQDIRWALFLVNAFFRFRLHPTRTQRRG